MTRRTLIARTPATLAGLLSTAAVAPLDDDDRIIAAMTRRLIELAGRPGAIQGITAALLCELEFDEDRDDAVVRREMAEIEAIGDAAHRRRQAMIA